MSTGSTDVMRMRADAGDVAPLPGPHVAEFPQADGLRLFAGANRGQEFFLEEEHVSCWADVTCVAEADQSEGECRHRPDCYSTR